MGVSGGLRIPAVSEQTGFKRAKIVCGLYNHRELIAGRADCLQAMQVREEVRAKEKIRIGNLWPGVQDECEQFVCRETPLGKGRATKLRARRVYARVVQIAV